MTITFLTARYPPDVRGGGEISTAITAEALVRMGYPVTVLCGARADSTQTNHGVKIVRSQALLPWWGKPLHEAAVSVRLARVVEALLAKSGRPDILHAHEFRSALSLAHLAHPARIVTIRDFAPICGTTNNLWWDGSSCDGCTWTNVLFRCHRVAEASLPRKPFRVWQYKGNLPHRLAAFQGLPVHVYTSDCLRERVRPRLQTPAGVKSFVIPNAIDPGWLSAAALPYPSAPVVSAVGRLETSKGTAVLLTAFSAVRQAVPTSHLRLVGGGEITRFQTLARTLGLQEAVTFHGTCSYPQVRDIIDASRIIVSPHLWEEPFGRVALEAGARRRPLVTSNLGGIRELTTPSTAVVVPSNDPEKLGQALTELLLDPARAERIGQAARLHVEKTYSAEHIARRHCDLYSGLPR